MANKIKNLVSKKKTRFKDHDFDLDLTYITKRIIAMGFPAEKLEGVYRNNIDDVVRFFEKFHKGHYKIYNLCNERSYDPEKFTGNVAKFPFEDHNVPEFRQIGEFCKNVDEYLQEDSENVVAVHCKAGKGRTGVMICAYLVHCGKYSTAKEALEYYGEKRTSNRKGVTIPSQQRYVHYYSHCLKNNLAYKETILLLEAVRFEGVPSVSNGSCSPYYVLFDSTKRLATSPQYEINRQAPETDLLLHSPTPVKGDIKLEFYHKTRMTKEKMFHCWFNTFFVVNPIPCTSSECDQSASPEEPSSRRNPLSKSPQPRRPVRNQYYHQHAEHPSLFTNNYKANSRPLSAAMSFSVRKTPSNSSHIHPSASLFDRTVSEMPPRGPHMSQNPPVRRASIVGTFTLTLTKCELDKANKDYTHKIYPKDFKITLFFSSYPTSTASANARSRANTAGDNPSIVCNALTTPRPPHSNLSSSLDQLQSLHADDVSSCASEDNGCDTDESDQEEDDITDIN